MARSLLAATALLLTHAQMAAADPVPAKPPSRSAGDAGSLPSGGVEFRQAMLIWSALAGSGASEPERLDLPFGAARLSSTFGARQDPLRGGVREHRGIDIPEPSGTPVRAAGGGVVTFAGWSGGYGNLVRIDHGAGVETRYGHLSAIAVSPGVVLQQGAMIGRIGSTGRSTGPHLHFEVRERGVAVNPFSASDLPIVREPARALPPPAPPAVWFDETGSALPRPGLR